MHEEGFKYLVSKQVESIDGLQSSFSEAHGAVNKKTHSTLQRTDNITGTQTHKREKYGDVIL